MTATADRFWAKVDQSGECWLWLGTRTAFGYGQFRYEGKTAKAHRVAWILSAGPIPADTPCVLHRCDNPPCVRPGHLFLGTLSDNMRDCAAKGRCTLQRPEAHRYGVDNPRGKLTDLDVAAIRGLKPARSAQALAAIFNVTDAHIRLLWRGQQRPTIPAAPLLAALRHITERTAA